MLTQPQTDSTSVIDEKFIRIRCSSIICFSKILNQTSPSSNSNMQQLMFLTLSFTEVYVGLDTIDAVPKYFVKNVILLFNNMLLN